MPIEMPKGLPFSVDTWSSSSMKKRYHFLTHAHKDHSSGITTYSSYPIYCTHFTRTLLLHHYPQLDISMFVSIEVGQSMVMDDPDGCFTVTAFDANHCAGAVMFLFEGQFGNILHTGDCRLTPECIQYLPERYVGKKGKEPRSRLDYVFLDCTFGSFSQKIPSKHSAVRQVVNCIWKHPDAPKVYLTCDLLGQEEILVSVSQTFGSKVFVDGNSNPDYHMLKLTVPEILSEDPASWFHLFDGFPKLYERAQAKLLEAKASKLPEPLILRPSTQWYACEDGSTVENEKRKRISEAVRDQFGVWHVCYSMHSSREELEWALQLLAPKWVVSTTPTCRAMELEYVRKHCFTCQATLSTSILKLMDLCVETSSEADVLVETGEICPSQKDNSHANADTQFSLKDSTNIKAHADSSGPSKSLPLTLFGRARHGLLDINFSQGFGSSMIIPSADKQEFLSAKEDAVDLNFEKSIENENDEEVLHETKINLIVEVKNGEVSQEEVAGPKSVRNKDDISVTSENNTITNTTINGRWHFLKINETVTCKKASYPTIGSSKGFSDAVRKLYRSRNVPVPQPLPSLVKLMKSTKRAKKVLLNSSSLYRALPGEICSMGEGKPQQLAIEAFCMGDASCVPLIKCTARSVVE